MNSKIPYPTLVDAAHALRENFGLSPVLRTFLTYLRPEAIPEAIQQEPEFLAPSIPKGAYYDAYLAALAEYLAEGIGVSAPSWTAEPSRVLATEPKPRPRYAALHQLLISETPPAFRRHGLVISANALEVA